MKFTGQPREHGRMDESELRSKEQIVKAIESREHSIELHAQSRELLAKSDPLLRRSNAFNPNMHMVRFVRTDLKVGFTFATIALRATNDVKRQRNTKKARKAYETVVRYLRRVHLSDTDKGEFKARIAELKAALQQLGEFV